MHFGASVEDFAIANDWRGQTLFAELVFGEQFETVGVGPKHEAFTGFVPGVDLGADENGRGGEGAPESVSPKFFAARGVPSSGDTRIEHAVEDSLVNQKGGNIDTRFVFPNDFSRAVG